MSRESLPLNTNADSTFRFQNYLTAAVLLGLILLLGTALRFYDLGTESYWIDEMSTVIEAQQSIPQMIASGRLDQPPAYYLPFHLWIHIFGTSEASTRSFSALFGIGSILIIYWIGRELFGKPVGLLSAFLMAISGFQIYYSQIARFYSYFQFMVMVSFLFFILVLREKKIVFFALYGAASILMVFSHTFGVFVLAAQNLIFVLQARTYRELVIAWVTCQALILIGFISYFWVLVTGEGGMGEAVGSNVGKLSAPTIMDPLHSVYRFILPARRVYGPQIVLASYAAAAALLVAGLSIYVIARGKSNWVTAVRRLFTHPQAAPDRTNGLLFVSCWLLCPIVLPFILSIVLIPLYKDYYTIGAAPALYLLLAFGIYNARKVMPSIISLGVLVVLIAPSLGVYYLSDMNEQWKEAAAYVESNSVSNDVIVFAPNENIGIQQRTFNWYYQGGLEECGLGVPLPDSAVWKALTQCVSGHERLWVIIRGTNDDPPHNRYTSFFLSSNETALNLIQEHQFVGVGVYLFAWTK